MMENKLFGRREKQIIWGLWWIFVKLAVLQSKKRYPHCTGVAAKYIYF